MRSNFGKLPYLSRYGLKLQKVEADRFTVSSEDTSEDKPAIVIRDLKFVITPKMEGLRLNCYNGVDLVSFLVTKNHIGFKVGSFVSVKKRVNHLK